MTSNKNKPVVIVDCYSGYKIDEKPISFVLGEKKHVIDRIMEQWGSPDFSYFKVVADDGKGCLLVSDNIKGDWILERTYEI